MNASHTTRFESRGTGNWAVFVGTHQVGEVQRGTFVQQSYNGGTPATVDGWYAVPMSMIANAHPERDGAPFFSTRKAAAEWLGI